MSQIIYDIDLSKEVTPLMVRDAIIQCFNQAHCMDSGMNSDEEAVNQAYCQEIVRKAFTDSGGDFDHPDKSSIMATLGKLADFSKNFRDSHIIDSHKDEIMKLVEKIK